MKCENIHAGFDLKEIRDFLAKSADFVTDEYIAALEFNLKQAEERLKEARLQKAAFDLVRQQGWEMFDVSDDVEDYSKEKYFNFVGTKKDKMSFDAKLLRKSSATCGWKKTGDV